jgi:DNA sulfur modification protein DndB
MNDEQSRRRLVVPALRAYMGDWIYYITFLTMRSIADMVATAEEIHPSKTLNDLIQRQLSNRADGI